MDELWVEVAVDLAPEVVDVDVDHVREAPEVVAPDLFDDHRAREWVALTRHQVLEQRELLLRHLDVGVAATHSSLACIEREITHLPDAVVRMLESTPSDRANPGEQLREGEGLLEVNVDTLEAPIHEENRVIPEQQLGGRLLGRLFPASGHRLEPEVEYSVYAGYGDEDLETGKPEGLSLGGDLRLWLLGKHLLGVSYYTQRNNELRNRREHNAMVYGELALPHGFLARAEYLHQWRDSRPGFAKRADVVYAKLRWDFHRRAYVNYRYNFGEDDSFGRTVNHSIHTLTLGVRPIPRVLAKFETDFHDLDRGIESYVSWGASLGLLF